VAPGGVRVDLFGVLCVFDEPQENDELGSAATWGTLGIGRQDELGNGA